MKLIMADTALRLPGCTDPDMTYINLATLKIAPCTGCCSCWVKTPTQCVIHDDAVHVYPLIAKAKKLLYVSKVQYGSYDSVMKTMLERTIPILQAFIHLRAGETRHLYRDVCPKQATVIGYGVKNEEEKQIFRDLVAQNARNMNFESYQVFFMPKAELNSFISGEISGWTGC